MPSRNRVKIYTAESYYHVYNRGISKRVIFKDSEDYAVFLNLLKRHLSKEPQRDKKNREYVWLYNDIELLAYCLMPNHFHLFVYQSSEDALSKLLKQVSMSYATYFNKKYGRIGPLFQDVYKASLIHNQSYFEHISRYIHLNPKNYKTWPYSSLPYYLGAQKAEWVRPGKIMNMYNSGDEYSKFLADYADAERMHDELKQDLANI